MLSDSIQLFQEEQLKKQIDEALDQGNKEKFMNFPNCGKQIQHKEN